MKMDITILRMIIKRAFRSIVRSKYFAIINLTGLSIGLACSFLLLLYILSEIGFDKCHENYNSIYRLTYYDPTFGNYNPHSSESLFEAVNKSVPEIQNSTILGRKGGSLYYKNKQIEAHGIGTNIDIFEIFTIPFVSGNYYNFNDDLNNIVISKELKMKLFGSQLAEGKYVDLEIGKELVPFKIVGVIENISDKSSIQADYFIHFKHLSVIAKQYLAEHYIQIPAKQTQIIESKVNDILASANVSQQLILQPLKDVHFKSGHLINNRTPMGDMNKIFLFSSIGLLILISSMINYVILASSRTLEKSKDIAIHRILGASRRNVISLVTVESLLIALLSFPLAIVLSELFLPFARNLLHNELVIRYFDNWPYISGIFLITIIIGFVSGSYTAFISTKILPIEGLRKGQAHKNKTNIQKALLILQLGIFTGLILFSMVIKSQLNYCLNYDMGFNKNCILNIDVNKKITHDQYLTFSNEVNKISGVIDCAYGSDIPSNGANIGTVQHCSIQDETVPIEYTFAGAGYLEMCGIELISGRYFEKSRNEKENILINETALKSFGISDPIGKMIDGKIVIGIVKDFVLHSLYEKIPPLIIYNNKENKLSNVLVSFESGINRHSVSEIKTIWDKMFPELPFEAADFGDIYEKMYQEDIKIHRSISIFAILAVIISSLGIFGMAHFTTTRRTKEIGIRKVNGAKIIDIIKLIHRQSVFPYIMALIWCLPVTYMLSLKWLNNFAYSTIVSIWEFILSIILSFIVFSFPIILQTYRASIVNPVKTLKYE